MAKIMTGSGYFSLEYRLEQTRKELTWTEFLMRRREQLEDIADICRLDTLWQDPYWIKGYALLLRLRYIGEAKNHMEASEDLGRIMDALHCTALYFKMTSGGGDHPPTAEYRGMCRLGQTSLELVLSVPWLPKGCTVHVSDERRTWSTTRRYSAYCRR